MAPADRDVLYGRFVGLLTACEPQIRRFVRSLMPGGDGVDDVVQNVALECWNKFEEFRAGSIAGDRQPNAHVLVDGSTRDGSAGHRTGELPLELSKVGDSGAVEGRVKDQDEFLRWAFVIARFKVLSHVRDASRRRLVFREDVIERLAEVSLDAESRADDERAAVEECLAKMNAEARRLLLSVHSSGDSVARIASETGEKARRLYSKLSVLRTRLAACVESRLAAEV